VWWRKEKGYVKMVFLDPLRKRRRQWLSVVALLLACLFTLGYARQDVMQEPIGPVMQPTMQLETLPRAPDTDEPRLLAQANVGGEKAGLAPEASPLSLKESCGDLGVLVDRSRSLPSDYVPPDLVPLQDYGIPTLGSETLRRGAAEHLGHLVESAAAEGEELVVASAYRSYHDQQLSHERLMSVFGAGADRMSATPGHSQHQLGTAVDFTNAAAGYQLWVPFAQTGAYLWLEDHALEYGFVLAYPRGEEEQSGYVWEPWHYRYVGVENAERLQKSELSLQEFLEREGTMPHC
jgi:zinc D-Ala-D-Ala carboxypeptidase